MRNTNCDFFKHGNSFQKSLARNNLPGLVSNLASNSINKFERKISGEGAVREGKVLLYLF